MRAAPKAIGRLLPICFICLVFFVIYTIYIEFVCIPFFQFDVDPQYRIPSLRDEGERQLFNFHILVLLLVWSFIMTSLTDPGYIPDEWKLDNNALYGCKERKKNGEFRYCKFEHCYKPDRAHYCRRLGRNVLKMDHYCPWVANCIGFYNYKFFFLTLFYSNVANCYILRNVYRIFFKVYIDPNASFNQLFYLALISTLLLVITGILVPFMFFHLWLISINKTTIEFCEWKASGSYNYNLGTLDNFKSVFGSNALLWFLPCGCPDGDGLHYPESPEDAKDCIPLDVTKGDHNAIESEYVHNLYEAIAPHFSHTRYNPWPGVVKHIKSLEPYSTVLDVGCGNGKYLELRKDLLFVGVDRCMGLLELAQNTKQSNLLRCDCLILPFRSDTAELTLSIAVIHHLVSSEQRKTAVNEMLRCTKSGGKVVIYVWAREQEKFTTGYRKFDSGDLLVPWHVQERYYKGKSAVGESPSTSGTIKLYRYYHVFTRPEVEELGMCFNNVAHVESIEFEANNWILTLLKL